MTRPAISASTALERAHALLDRIALVDGHNDLPIVIRRAAKGDIAGYDLTRVHQDGDTDIPRLREGRLTGQFFAAFVPTSATHPARTTLEQIDVARRIALTYPDVFLLATRSSDLARAKKAGKIAAFVTVESGVGLENALAPLRVWYEAGVRLLTLCHNETLAWVDSATDQPKNGLTRFGRAVVEECNRLGIIVDLAHVAPSSMHQVLDTTRAPVLWSHSNAFTLCSHPRNVPDDVLDRVPQSGGVVMLTFVPAFLNQATRDWYLPVEDGFGKVDQGRRAAAQAGGQSRGLCPPATLEHYLDHMDYIVAKVGIEHVGIGSDFFGGLTPQGLENVSCFPGLVAGLMRRGYSDRDIAKIASGNLLRVFRKVEHKAKELATESPRLGRIEELDG